MRWLQSLNERIYDDLRALVRQIVALIERPGREPDLETERLYALVDGLVLHAVLRPEQWPPERITAVLSYHLDKLGACGSRSTDMLVPGNRGI